MDIAGDCASNCSRQTTANVYAVTHHAPILDRLLAEQMCERRVKPGGNAQNRAGRLGCCRLRSWYWAAENRFVRPLFVNQAARMHIESNASPIHRFSACMTGQAWPDGRTENHYRRGGVAAFNFFPVSIRRSTLARKSDGATPRTSHSLKSIRMLALFFPSSSKLT